MSAPPFTLIYQPEVEAVLARLDTAAYRVKRKKVLRTLKQLEMYGPRHPGLNSHRYQSAPGLHGQPLWESYVENRTPGAWRIWWVYGPQQDQITVVTIGPHPD